MNQNRLYRADFQYDLPASLIAQLPSDKRDESRLLEYKNGEIRHHRFSQIADTLPVGSLIVLNDTRVIPGRIMGTSPHGGRFELMLIQPSHGSSSTHNRWHAMGRPMKKFRLKQVIDLVDNCKVEILAKRETSAGPMMELEFSLQGQEFDSWLEQHGRIPLPPYIQRKDKDLESHDRERYQTVYANEKGSVAAPTAGLHFTQSILESLQQRGIEICPVTLHVGAGTFLPVKADNPDEHRMHSERYFLSRTSYEKLISALDQNRPIIAVGTTSFRCLQSFHRASLTKEPSELLDRWLETDLFIYPKYRSDRYRPWAVNGLITNFHQPESTLLMMISALLGLDEVMRIYSSAIAEEYRFFSYGDTSLLWLDRLVNHVD